MSTKLRAAVLLCSIAVAGLGASASANAGALWEFTTPGGSFNNNTWDFAQAFTVGSANLTVTGLGYYADPTNGQVASNPVALYQCSDAACTGTGTEIASAVVTNTYPLTGHFRYVTITPVTLQAGMSYEVAGVSFGDNYTWDDSGFTVNSDISLVSEGGGTDRWEQTGAPDFLTPGNSQTDLNGEDGYWGPNVFVGQPTFTGVPEPDTWALFGAGLALLGLAIRRRAAA